MEINGNVRKWAVSGIVPVAGMWFMNVPGAVLALWALQALDIATGTLSAYVRKELSSEVSRVGIARKVQTNLLVLAVYVIERLMPEVGFPVSFTVIVALFYAAHEALSILENAAEIGLPIPNSLRQALARVTESDQRREEAKEGEQRRQGPSS